MFDMIRHSTFVLLSFSLICHVTTSIVEQSNPSDLKPSDPQKDQNLQLNFARHLLQANRTYDGARNLSHTILQDRERKRQERLAYIQSQILSRLGVSLRPNTSSVNSWLTKHDRQLLSQVYKKLRNREDELHLSGEVPRSDIVFEKLQSFYPSCKIPNQSDQSRWCQQTLTGMKLYFDLNLTDSGNLRKEILIILAKLRLFRHDTSPVESDSPTSTPSPIVTFEGNSLNQTSRLNGITFAIYQYLRPLKSSHKKERRRLVDIKTIPSNHQGWVEFNLSQCLSFWKQHPNKNFGLLVECTDSSGNKLDPSNFMVSMNCTGFPGYPLPNVSGVLMEIIPSNATSLFSDRHYPTLDLMTVEYRPKNE
ncbi:uncharacterized protein LOC141851980 [Brevipalpus obovatus]|uniref:uncharacterized protein LOC141851980 n=1 Tax=Brevipalpus obovatus TaxID=246614 RepID=UPI003D9E67B3